MWFNFFLLDSCMTSVAAAISFVVTQQGFCSYCHPSSPDLFFILSLKRSLPTVLHAVTLHRPFSCLAFHSLHFMFFFLFFFSVNGRWDSDSLHHTYAPLTFCQLIAVQSQQVVKFGRNTWFVFWLYTAIVLGDVWHSDTLSLSHIAINFLCIYSALRLRWHNDRQQKGNCH